jgi:muramidase (phage lysozyme)
MSVQLSAFLAMIATSEGTAAIGDTGYNCLVGSTARQPILFGSYADHPRVKVQLRPDLVSTAAGRYQILARFFDAYKATLKLSDFSPGSQDAIAAQMIRERNALVDIEAGRFDEAVAKVKNIWASLPGSGYGQHENQLADLRDAFVKAGGQVA